MAMALCADDYAISAGVSRAICELMAQDRLYSTSCLTVSRFWPEHAGWLTPYAARSSIGIHLALTHFAPLPPSGGLGRDGRLPGLRNLIVGAVTGQLPRAAIRDELQRQFDAFESVMGRKPDYVSAHNHVHQFPVIRDIVFDLTRTRTAQRCVRMSDEPFGEIRRRGVASRRAAIVALLALGSRGKARRLGLRMNQRFAGIYDFAPQLVYRDVFRRYIQSAPHGLAVMCHPGHVDADVAALDSTVDSRPRELAYFAGPDVLNDLGAAGLFQAPFTTICTPLT
jgi:predicted glycoside hydrolase/deacetylase ChbG (UPF0249 family)